MSADRGQQNVVENRTGGLEAAAVSAAENSKGTKRTVHADMMGCSDDAQLAQIDAALDALMAVVGDASGAGKDDLESLVLYHVGAFITDPRVLNRAGTYLAVAEEQGDQEIDSKLRRIIQSIETLKARDTEDLDDAVFAAHEFRETVEALNFECVCRREQYGSRQ